MGFNGSRTIRNFASCRGTLVYREKRSNNSSIHTLKGTSFLVPILVILVLFYCRSGSCAFPLNFYLFLFQAVVLDQGLEADLVADIQKYLEDLINTGLRQRLISLMKV